MIITAVTMVTINRYYGYMDRYHINCCHGYTYQEEWEDEDPYNSVDQLQYLRVEEHAEEAKHHEADQDHKEIAAWRRGEGVRLGG